MTRKHITYFLFAIACCAVSALSAGNAAGAIIRLKSNAAVSSSVVILADVAEVFDRDPQVVAALQRATLMPAPAAGRDVEVSFSAIRNRLKALGYNLADVEMTGNSSVVIQNSAPQRNQRAAKPKISRRQTSPATSWQIRRARQLLSNAILRYLQTTELGDVDIELKFEAAWARHVISGQRSGYEISGGRPPWDAWQTLKVRFIDGEETLQTMHVQCRVVAKPLVPVAQHALPSGHVITRSDIIFRRVDTVSARYPAIEELVGRETKRALRRGQPVDSSVIRQVPLIRRGDVVTAVAHVGGIRVKRQLHARSDGAMGERVTLSTLDRKEQIEATVSGYHEAIVLDSRPAPTRQVSTDIVRGQSLRPRPSVDSPAGRRFQSRNLRPVRPAMPATTEPSRRSGGAL